MADTPQTLASIAAALAQTYPDEVKRQINRRSVLLSILPVMRGSGKNVAWDVEGDGAIAENFAEGAAVANFGSDEVLPATLNWALYRSNFRVTNLGAAGAGSSQSPGGLRDLVGRNLFNVTGKLASALNAAFYTGAGTGSLVAGLGVAVDSTGVYAGIDSSVKTFWQSYEVDASAAALTLAHIRTDTTAIYTNCGSRPDIALCAPAVLNKVKGLFDGQRQWNRDVLTARGRTTLEHTSDVVVVEGCQFIEDKDCPANSIFYLNSSDMAVEVLPQAVNFADPLAAADDGFNTLMLGFQSYELGRTGSDRRMSVEAQLQLKITKRNAHGKRENIG